VAEAPRLPGVLSDVESQPIPTYVPEPLPNPFAPETTEAPAQSTQGPLDLRIWPEAPIDTATPLDILVRENARRLLTEQTVPTFQQPSELTQAPGVEPDQTGVWPSSVLGPVPAPGAGLEPGGDVFTDMQLALELSQNPQAEWYTDMFGAAGTIPSAAQSETPTSSIERQAYAVEAAGAFLARLFETPLQTFVGRDATAVNDELRKAETALATGQYYDAVRHYERVRVLDPTNPLPIFGQGHALLAAGEYVSAANSLINGLERFPEFASFQIDLEALIGGGEIVDIRRADLIRQLARNEDPQLRFLLGYLEVHAGMIEFGLQNLEKAAGDADPGSLIRRYPEMIRHKAWLGPQLLPESVDSPGPPDADAPAEHSAPSEEEPK
jgi:hypothetical protein